ncbi:hypothetical protein WME75_43115 [Sorangium sp. So ce1014]|uniref:hypothetical protein n=1 Tax=Sorangium sp. So ce1014 TaxID=3133326 RepID=UPI003F5E0C83
MSLRTSALVLVAISFPFGCGPRPPVPPEPPPTPPAPSPSSQRVAPPNPAAARASRGLLHNGMPRNGLSVQALAANKSLLNGLAREPLNSASVRPAYLAIANSFTNGQRTGDLKDTSSLMEYITSCALDPGAVVTVNASEPRIEWKGELGLCDESSPLGDWSEEPATSDCEQAVSACVLARVNANGDKVVISMRGEPEQLFRLQPVVPVETYFREKGGTPIPSIHQKECSDKELQRGESRNCGFSPRFVGRCQPESRVTITSTQAGVGSYPRFVRICEGLHACDHPKEPGEVARSYSRHLLSGHIKSENHRITFTCPGNRADPRRKMGYYSVMVASPQGGDPGFDAQVSADGSYPATEAEVFTYLEGAFYGNLFDGSLKNLSGSPAMSDMLAANQYACFSHVWRYGKAYMADRLCLSPEDSCFVNQPGQCWPPSGATGQCEYDNVLYPECQWRPQTYKHPVTIYLNDPCDLSGNAGAEACSLDGGLFGASVTKDSAESRGKPDRHLVPTHGR